jgi:predicted P-loop ATPase
LGILRWLKYITNRTFHKEGAYEEMISEIEKDNQDKILVVINDNSNHGYVKRCYICVYTEDELKS